MLENVFHVCALLSRLPAMTTAVHPLYSYLTVCVPYHSQSFKMYVCVQEKPLAKFNYHFDSAFKDNNLLNGGNLCVNQDVAWKEMETK